MQSLLRRVRGAIGMGLAWGVAWGGAGFVLAVATRFRADAPFPLIFGVLGFIAGVIFSAVLALTERRRTLDQLSLPRFAGWGATGGVVLAALFARGASLGWVDLLAVVPTFALACGACASGSLALARRAMRRELSVGGENHAGADLTGRETQKLLRDED